MRDQTNAKVEDLLEFIDSSPTPFHAVGTAIDRLASNGFSALDETEEWNLTAGDCRYCVRNDGTLIAFVVGTASPAEAGFRLIGAHTDSPTLHLKRSRAVKAAGFRQLRVEPYGGVLLHTWFDRDLGLAGRVICDGSNGLETHLLRVDRPLLRVANLAIHLSREVRDTGFRPDPAKHLDPIWSTDESADFRDFIAAELNLGTQSADSIVGFDLMTFDLQASAVGGRDEEFIFAPRLDNLASCHAGLSALTETCSSAFAPTRIVVLYDHEEVGSHSERGAAGPIVSTTLDRIVAATGSSSGQDLGRAIANSTLVSADMAHALHPNYRDRHDLEDRPLVGRGPVIKSNANLAYATDAAAAGAFVSLAKSVDVETQLFSSRNDLPCGSTIGPISAARLGIRTVDVGNPMLSMHSCREMAGAADVEPMIRVLQTFFSRDS